MESVRKSRKCFFRLMVGSVIFIMVIFFSNQIILAGENSDGSDSLFDNAIRSMTAPKPPLQPSGDPRYQNNQDGTITDLEHGLMWKQRDSYQEKKEWTNWEVAHIYVQEIIEFINKDKKRPICTPFSK